MATVTAVMALAINVQPILDAQLTTQAGQAAFAQKVQYYVNGFQAKQREMVVLQDEMKKENPDNIVGLQPGTDAYRAQAVKAQGIYNQFKVAEAVRNEMLTYVAAGGDALKDLGKVVNLAQAYQEGKEIPADQQAFLQKVATICERSLN
jgi:hypothetical protein